MHSHHVNCVGYSHLKTCSAAGSRWSVVSPLETDVVDTCRDAGKKTNQALGLLDNKGRYKTAGSLRKRWRKLRVENRAAFDALCSVYILRKGNQGIVDHCTHGSNLWQAKYFK
ncbi:hypothetical protein PF005_g8004 [Phytophthora fragariae]|uniref:Uncharacterized protein n=1 Tax=Phytophthora fragariae TaxID=53985 RepID=A0A6A3YKG8_9STRA|nr:hypothetical protein PF005_g8004 [Phytophthora fragariae]